MKKLKLNIIFIVSVILLLPAMANSQVLISLLLGDALNTDKIEFGLVGGFNRSYIVDIEDSEGLNNFNLGFYFHFKLLESSYLNTGVLVKSTVGARGMPTYPIGDTEFDDVYSEGELIKKIHYFYVPVMWQQRFHQRWILEGGIQLGLRNKADDIFSLDAYDGELKYTNDVRNDYKRFDGGLVGGLGYKFLKQPKSISAGINYYYGLNDVSKNQDVKIVNSSFYVYLKIPIGAGAQKTKNE